MDKQIIKNYIINEKIFEIYKFQHVKELIQFSNETKIYIDNNKLVFSKYLIVNNIIFLYHKSNLSFNKIDNNIYYIEFKSLQYPTYALQVNTK